MKDNMVLILVDECGDEREYARYTVGDDLDEDYLELWKDIKIAKAAEEYPEAHFYFEDRRNWNSMINRCMWDPTYESCFY